MRELATVRGRAARLLEAVFLPHVKNLVAAAPVAHADETAARADGCWAPKSGCGL